MPATTTSDTLLTPDALLAHWQGHRRLTRRVIEAFPEDELFSYHAPEMRSFGTLALEMIGMVAPTLRGLETGDWDTSGGSEAKDLSKSDLLARWDETTKVLEENWPNIPERRFLEVDTAFGQWTMPGIDMVFYLIDNEIHHRGQGYVYLRSLGVEPPAFWER